MQYRSYWQQQVRLPRFEELNGNVACDVLIVGAGLCGLLTALELIERGVDAHKIAIIDANQVGSGTSALATAKVTAQHGLIYDRLTRAYGIDAAAQYATANLRAVERARILAKQLGLCHVQRLSTAVYAITEEERALLEAEYEACLALGLPAELTDDVEVPVSAVGALKLYDQAAIQPVEYMKAIVRRLSDKGCMIYENTKALYPERNAVVTDKGKIFAKAVVISTRFPFADKRGLYFVKLRQQRSYLLMLGSAQKISGCYIGVDRGGLSFRPYEDMLLVCGTLDEQGKPYTGFIDLIHRCVDLYPDCQVLSKWSAEDCVTYDGIPYIGRYEGLPGEVYLATGFNTWGMSTSFAAARILAEQITRGYADEQQIFSPARTLVLNGWKKLFIHSAEVAADFLTGFFPVRKKERVRHCTHMDCPLRWNAAEQTWDCPCHGSRFDAEGNVVSGPAQEPLPEERTERNGER